MFKKTLLLMTLFLALFGVAKAQTTVTIGEGTATCNTNPIGTYYNYSITEQLYTADEIGMAGTISSISFYYLGIAAKDLPITVYMKHVDEENLASAGISLADADEVFSGTLPVTTTAGWVTINLDTPFAFDGTSNLLIGFIKDYLYYFSGQSWQGTATTTTMARYTQNDSNAYDLTTTPSSAQANRPNIQMVITAGSGPVCDKPDTMEASNVTTNSATLTWTGGSGTYNVEYKGGTVTDWTSYLTNTTATTANLTNLAPGTSYSYRVQSVCSDGVSGWKSVSFQTMFGIPLVESFGTAIPDGWALYSGLLATVLEDPTALATATYGWSFGTSNSVFDNHAYANIYGTSSTKWLAMPAVVMEDNVQLKFDVAYTAYSGSGNPAQDGTDDKFVVLANINGTWTILRQWDNAGSEYVLNDLGTTPVTITFDLSAYAGQTVQVAFYAESTEYNADNNIHIDNVSINYIPSCLEPTDLAVEYNGGTSATVTWVGTSRAYNLNVNGRLIEGVDSPYNMSGLEYGTLYTVMVQSDCGGETSDWSHPVTFTTECQVYDIPYSCSFESEEEIVCWTVINTSTSNIAGITTNQSYDGDASFQFTSYSSASSYDQYLISPEMNGQAFKYNFIYAPYNAGDVFKVGYSTTTNDITVFTWGDEITGDVQTWQEYIGACPEGTKYVALWYYGNYAYYLWVDNFNITVDDGCRVPTDFTASNLSGHSAELSWTENGEATEWVIAYMAETDTVISYASANTNPFTLEGLEPTTLYYAMVSPNCGEIDSWSDVISWTTLDACPKPQITIDPILPTSATVNWTGFASDYEFEWAEKPETTTKDALWLQYDNGTLATGIGNGSTQYTWTWGVMYPASMFGGNSLLSKVSFYETAEYSIEDITINIYSGGDDAPETLIYSETVTPTGTDGFHEVALAQVVNFDITQNLWITLTEYGYYVINACTGTESNNDWVDNGGWYHIGDLASSLAGYNWMIRGYVEPSFDPDQVNWQPIAGATSPVTLDNLTPDTDYLVRIKALCGDPDGESEWATVMFHTPDACTTPSNLTAEAAAKTADLSWAGYTETYNVRYRVAEHIDAIFSDNFDESNMNQWTTIDADGDGYDWMLATASAGVYHNTGVDLTGNGHNGSNDFVTSGSFSNFAGEALNPDNYLVSPQVALGSTFEFWACAQDAGYPAEVFGVAVSTTGNTTASDFNTIQQWTMTAKSGDWYKYTVDLSAYSGDGYIAIRHFDCTDQFMLNVDDIAYGTPVAAGEWMNTVVTGNTYTLTGLTPKTPYEWQVQGINCSDAGNTDWSEIATFTTTELTTVTQTITLASGANYVSFYVNVSLDDLKAALVAALPAGNSTTITIKSRNQNVKYQRGRWSGQLATLNMANMYTVIVSEACEITFEDTPIDPSTLSVDMINGANWIAFPYETSMTVTNFFAGFAQDQDQVKSRTTNSKYQRGRWGGALTTLEPGQGYIYVTSTPRTFYFPTPSKGGDKAVQSPMTTGSTPNKMAKKDVTPKTIDMVINRPTVKTGLTNMTKMIQTKEIINLNIKEK